MGNTPLRGPWTGWPPGRQGVISLLLLCVLAPGCADSLRPAFTPSGQPLTRLTVLTYNTLHGLEPSGLTVKAGESKEVRQARLNLQVKQLSIVQPDVMLLQEVNPLPEM